MSIWLARKQMSKKTYILCPGQGAQVVGMGKDFYDASPAAREVFDRANKLVDFDLPAVCFNGPEDQLNRTDISQPAIYVTSIAAMTAGKAAGKIEPETVTAFAGLSLGEYTALHLAGAFDFETGLKLVAARGKLMQAAAVASPSGMVAIMGADEDAVSDLCRASAKGEVLVAANFNAPGQIVVSGSSGACERFKAAAESAGFKAVALKVAGAFHSPLMQSGADNMARELESASIRMPRKPVYSNVTAKPHTDVASIRKLLVDQIVKPVRWEQTMHTLLSAGMSAGVNADDVQWVELAPGRVLTGLLKKINRRLPVQSLATA